MKRVHERRPRSCSERARWLRSRLSNTVWALGSTVGRRPSVTRLCSRSLALRAALSRTRDTSSGPGRPGSRIWSWHRRIGPWLLEPHIRAGGRGVGVGDGRLSGHVQESDRCPRRCRLRSRRRGAERRPGQARPRLHLHLVAVQERRYLQPGPGQGPRGPAATLSGCPEIGQAFGRGHFEDTTSVTAPPVRAVVVDPMRTSSVCKRCS